MVGISEPGRTGDGVTIEVTMDAAWMTNSYG